jgi:hypothetical protein
LSFTNILANYQILNKNPHQNIEWLEKPRFPCRTILELYKKIEKVTGLLR